MAQMIGGEISSGCSTQALRNGGAADVLVVLLAVQPK